MIGVSAAIGVGYTLAMFFATVPATATEREEKTRGMMRFCAMYSNNGFLGIPLAQAVFGNSLAVMVLIIINIITNVFMYTLGVYLISRDKKTISFKKAFLNPVVISFVLGIILNVCKINSLALDPTNEIYSNTFFREVTLRLTTYSNYFQTIVTPISMTILGMKMAGVKFLSLFTSWKTYYVSALKLVVFPCVIMTILLGLKAAFGGVVTADVLKGAFVSFATPTAGLASTFADTHNGDSENAVAFTLGSTILSVATLPLLYWALCALL
jgi:predicted permease